jgi:replicative DNA helicase
MTLSAASFAIEKLAEPGYRAAIRTPPANVELEIALLGAILVNNRAYEKVGEFLAAEHFAEPAHARIFAACHTLIQRGQQASPATLKLFFEQDGSLNEVGGVRYLAELAASALTIIDTEHYGRAIHDLALRRQLIGIGEDIVNDAYKIDLEDTASDQIEAAEHKLFELAGSGQSEGGFQEFGRTLVSAIRMAETAFRREGQLTGVNTGFTRLNALLGGLQRSDLIILAGRPGMGKTAFATNMAFNAARSEIQERGPNGEMTVSQNVVAFFSLEMSAEQLALRILGEQSGVSSDRIRRGQISSDEFNNVFRASQEIARYKIFIDDTPGLSVSALRTRARRLKRTQKRLDMIVVDYLQLMRPAPGSRQENRVQEISEITRGLKGLAKELDVPVVALSQLSRAVEQREDKRPQLADLRESGSIEQDADVVMFVYREEYYEARKEPSNGDSPEWHEWHANMERIHKLAEVIVAKQRHGPTDKVQLQFEGELTRFGDLDTSHHESGEAPF